MISCPHCHQEIKKVEMPSFSFNKPEGACKTCNGIGQIVKINEKAVFNLELSINEGGVSSLKGVLRDIQVRILETASSYYGFEFDANEPLKNYGEI